MQRMQEAGRERNPNVEPMGWSQRCLIPSRGGHGGWRWVATPADQSAPAGRSVDRSGLRDPDALDPESAAERLEVAIVVKDRKAAFGGGRRDHVVGGWQPALAAQLA